MQGAKICRGANSDIDKAEGFKQYLFHTPEAVELLRQSALKRTTPNKPCYVTSWIDLMRPTRARCTTINEASSYKDRNKDTPKIWWETFKIVIKSLLLKS
uniref:Uncharacterized protein n=1 Tax=Austropuccinia psidii TaxID=181123 RepID=A0A513X046_9BASI|nr:hypothetical protein [Austropuccinia psidii]QDH07307.1 hypothetical protein [Austropuccinia psidii]